MLKIHQHETSPYNINTLSSKQVLMNNQIPRSGIKRNVSVSMENKYFDLVITFARPPPGTCPMLPNEFTLDFAFLLKSIFFVSTFTPPDTHAMKTQY